MEESLTINVRGRLMDLSTPRVMGILNVTPDSFYAGSRTGAVQAAVERVGRMLAEGADIIDIGAVSTRPGAAGVSADEEMRRLEPALEAIRSAYPDAVLSLDTFRADVARRGIDDFGIDMVNDVSGGADPSIYKEVSRTRVPYIIMHGATGMGAAEVPATDTPNLVPDMLRFFAERVQRLHDMGVADVVIDPGFGFGKTRTDNLRLMGRLDQFHVLGCPLLVGVSRKSMISQTLGISADEALNGTTVLNTLALAAGAHILRVHDVRPAVEAVRLVGATNVKH